MTKSKFVNEEGSVGSLLPPTMYTFKRINGGVYVIDNMGVAATMEEIQELATDLEASLNYVDSVLIEENNKAVADKLNGKSRGATPPEKRRVKLPGFVYILKADNGLYKIGKSLHVEERVNHLTVKLPYDMETVYQIFTNDYTGLEKHLHKLFSKKRLKGEWFELREEDIQFVKDEWELYRDWANVGKIGVGSQYE